MIYQVWAEGWRFQQNRYPCELLGEVEATSFEHACIKICDHTLNRKNLTINGRHLFDNQRDASVLFSDIGGF